jgi:flagellar FliJ protein
MADALTTILRLRGLAVAEAKRALAARLQEEDVAAVDAGAAERALAVERNAASAMDVGDGAVEAYAAWLPLGHRVLDAARERSRNCEAGTMLARARLAAAQGAHEAAERMQATRDAEARLEALKAEHLALDDLPRRPRSDSRAE